MGKRAKRGKAETLALPMIARVAIGAVAVVALGYSLLSRPASVQPIRKPSAPQAQASSTPVYVATPVHASAPAPAPIPAPAPQVEPPKAADGPGAFVRQVVDYTSHQAPGTVIIDVGVTVWTAVYDWHVRWKQPLVLGRDSNGRYTLVLGFTTLVLRHDSTPTLVGIPYENR